MVGAAGQNEPIAIAGPVQAETTGAGNDSSRWDSSKPVRSMSIEAWASPSGAPEVETTAEHPLVPGDQHRAGALALGLVERAVDLGASMAGPKRR